MAGGEDERFGLELVDITHLVGDSGFGVFKSVAEAGGIIKGIKAPGCAGWSRREIDQLIDLSRAFGAKGPWALVGAVRASRVVTLPGDLLERPGPRLVDALEKLVALLAEEKR